MKLSTKQFLMLIMALVVQVSFAQEKSVTGTVTDSNGLSLPGVNIIERGTSNGVQSDFDGKYSITTTKGSQLIFSFIGFTTKAITVGDNNTIDVQLEEDAAILDEVVVTGVASGTNKKKLGVAVNAVTSEDLIEGGVTSVDQALQGKIAGTIIQSTSGQPGQQQNIILRSINSLNSSNPLILIDGIQVITTSVAVGGASNQSSRLTDIDFSNVERVETISGAAAGTIYGAQGANGVINIITKKGKAGKTVVNIRSNVGVSSAITGKNDIHSKLHRYTINDSGFIITGDGTQITDLNDEFQYLAPIPESRDVNGSNLGNGGINDRPFSEQTFDPLETIFRDALSTNFGVGISGGSEKITYSVNANRTTQESVLIIGEYVKQDARLNLNIDVTDKLKIGTRFDVINTQNNTGANTDQAADANVLSSVYQSNQYVNFDLLNADGDRVVAPDLGDANASNPIFERDRTQRLDDINRYIANLNIDYQPFNVLNLNVKYGYDSYSQALRFFQGNDSDHQQAGDEFTNNVDGIINLQTTREFFQNLLAAANLNIDFREDLKIDFDLTSTTTATFDWRDRNLETLSVTGNTLPFGALEDFNINRAITKTFNSFFASPFRTYGFLVNQKFDFGTLFGFSAGIRTDVSNRFGTDQSFTFPRADAYFNIGDLINSDNVNTLKVRAAYGEAGIQPLFGQNLLTLGPLVAGADNPLSLNPTLQNPDLGVEISKELEIGIDYNFSLGGSEWLTSLSGSANYFTRENEGAIFNVDQAISPGAGSVIGNGYDISSDGIEVNLDLGIANSEKFGWDLGVRFSSSKAIIDRIASGQALSLGNNFILEEGQEVGSLSVQQVVTDINQTNAAGERYIDLAGLTENDVTLASSGYLVQKNTGQVILTPERNTIGSTQPDYVLTLINDFRINNFVRFSFQWDRFQGLDVYNRARQWLYQSGLQVHADTAVPVTIEDPTGIPQTGAFGEYYNSLYNTNDPVSEFIEDASFWRLRNVSLTFNLNNIAKLDFLDRLDLTISGRNLITITDYKGLDPEAARTFNNTFQRGFDEFTLPNTKSFNFGINITL